MRAPATAENLPPQSRILVFVAGVFVTACAEHGTKEEENSIFASWWAEVCVLEPRLPEMASAWDKWLGANEWGTVWIHEGGELGFQQAYIGKETRPRWGSSTIIDPAAALVLHNVLRRLGESGRHQFRLSEYQWLDFWIRRPTENLSVLRYVEIIRPPPEDAEIGEEFSSKWSIEERLEQVAPDLRDVDYVCCILSRRVKYPKVTDCESESQP